MMTRLMYLANSRLPTEKAHGLQISRMCEAFAASGADVLLVHPYRHQVNAALRGRSVFDYYSVRPAFEVRTLPNWDVVPLERFLPGGVSAGLSVAQAVGWGLYAAVYAANEPADLYYTRDVEVAFWLTRLGLPTVLEIHAVPRKARRALLRRVACHRSLRLMVTLTSFSRDRLLALGVPKNDIVILPDGVDLALFDDLPDKGECRRQLGLPLDRSIIGYVGRFQTLGREKGISELIGALAGLRFEGREPLLLCVGGPMDVVPEYMALAERHGVPAHRLKFVDHVPASQVPCWIRACDVATLPLPWEEHYAYFSSPLKIFEYMAAEVPIVATSLPAVQEVVRHGETGWLVEPGSATALGAGIASVLRNPDVALRMARRARQEVEQYTWMRRASSILDLSRPSRVESASLVGSHPQPERPNTGH